MSMGGFDGFKQLARQTAAQQRQVRARMEARKEKMDERRAVLRAGPAPPPAPAAEVVPLRPPVDEEALEAFEAHLAQARVQRFVLSVLILCGAVGGLAVLGLGVFGR